MRKVKIERSGAGRQWIWDGRRKGLRKKAVEATYTPILHVKGIGAIRAPTFKTAAFAEKAAWALRTLPESVR